MRKQSSSKKEDAQMWPGKSAGDMADSLVKCLFDNLKKYTLSVKQEEEKEKRTFFPNGIELIHFKVKVSSVELELKVAGAAGVKGLLSQNEISRNGEIALGSES